jgi:hypothetical protein
VPNIRENANPRHGMAGLRPVTPVEIDRVRRSALDVVRKNIPVVRQVLAGERKWTNQQVRLFGMMLNKVMPDLSASFNTHTHEHKNIDELSIEELHKIAAAAVASSPSEEAISPDVEDAEIVEDDPYLDELPPPEVKPRRSHKKKKVSDDPEPQ